MLEVITWFTQPIPSTDGITDAKSLANEMIECDITGFDVPSVFSRCEFDSSFTFDCRHSFLLDQREVIPIVAFLVWLPLDECSGLDLAEISVTPKATSGDSLNPTPFGHFDFGFRSSENSFDSASTSHTQKKE